MSRRRPLPRYEAPHATQVPVPDLTVKIRRTPANPLYTALGEVWGVSIWASSLDGRVRPGKSRRVSDGRPAPDPVRERSMSKKILYEQLKIVLVMGCPGL